MIRVAEPTNGTAEFTFGYALRAEDRLQSGKSSFDGQGFVRDYWAKFALAQSHWEGPGAELLYAAASLIEQFMSKAHILTADCYARDRETFFSSTHACMIFAIFSTILLHSNSRTDGWIGRTRNPSRLNCSQKDKIAFAIPFLS